MEFINNSISVDCENACLKYVVMCVLVHQKIICANNIGIIGLPMEFDVQGHPLGMVYDDIVLGRKPKSIKDMLDCYSSRADILACASYSLLDVNRINSPDYFLSGTIGCLGDGQSAVDKEMVASHCLYAYDRLSIGYVETNPAETYAAYVYAMREVRDAFRESSFVKLFMSNCDNAGWKNVADAHLGIEYSNYDTACELLSGDDDFKVIVDVGRYLLLGGVAAATFVSLCVDGHNGERNIGYVADFKKKIDRVVSCMEREILPFLNNQHGRRYGLINPEGLEHQLNDFCNDLKKQQAWLKIINKAHKPAQALLVLRVFHAVKVTGILEDGDDLCIEWVNLISNILGVSIDRKIIINWMMGYKKFNKADQGKIEMVSDLTVKVDECVDELKFLL